MVKNNKCSHINKGFTWQGKYEDLVCVLDKHDNDILHKGVKKVLGEPLLHPENYEEDEIFVDENGISHIIRLETCYWNDGVNG